MDADQMMSDPIPAAMRADMDLPDIHRALEGVHRPTTWQDIERGRERLIFEEAFVLQANLVQRRHAARTYRASVVPPAGSALRETFDAGLPFTLTDGQKAVGNEIAADLAREVPMSGCCRETVSYTHLTLPTIPKV